MIIRVDCDQRPLVALPMSSIKSFLTKTFDETTPDYWTIQAIAGDTDYEIAVCSSREECLEVIDDMLAAYERGDKVYRMPKVTREIMLPTDHPLNPKNRRDGESETDFVSRMLSERNPLAGLLDAMTGDSDDEEQEFDLNERQPLASSIRTRLEVRGNEITFKDLYRLYPKVEQREINETISEMESANIIEVGSGMIRLI